MLSAICGPVCLRIATTCLIVALTALIVMALYLGCCTRPNFWIIGEKGKSCQETCTDLINLPARCVKDITQWNIDTPDKWRIIYGTANDSTSAGRRGGIEHCPNEAKNQSSADIKYANSAPYYYEAASTQYKCGLVRPKLRKNLNICQEKNSDINRFCLCQTGRRGVWGGPI